MKIKITQSQLFALMSFRVVNLERAAYLSADEFYLIGHTNTADILAIGNNDDHFVGIIAGITVRDLELANKYNSHEVAKKIASYVNDCSRILNG